MPDLKVHAPYEPTGDQPAAIGALVDGIGGGLKHQVLLGATGTGKSLAPDEPVLVGRSDSHGDLTWSLEPIGPLVDAQLERGARYLDDHGAEVAFATTDDPGMVVVTIDPVDHRTVARPVTAYSRHPSPERMWQVRTTDGRSVTVTGDHNFVRLSAGARLGVVETEQLRPSDHLPLPRRLPPPEVPMRRLDIAEHVGDDRMYVTGPEVLGRATGTVVRSALAGGKRARLSAVGHENVAVLERFGDTRITSSNGTRSLPASVPVDSSLCAFLGLFVAEGHVADSYATITPGPENVDLTRRLMRTCGIEWYERGRDELGIGSRVVTELLRTTCGQRAGEKHLPSFWPNLSNEALGRLLAGYFEGDGWVERHGASVCATTKSEGPASELAYALLRFGIVARIGVTRKRASGTPHRGGTYYQVSVRGAQDLRAFATHVGFLSARKARQLSAIIATVQGGNADLLPPVAGRLLREARLSIGAFEREVAALAGMTRTGLDFIEIGRRGLRRETGIRLVRALRDLADHRGLRHAADYFEAMDALDRLLECRWVRVASVTEVPASSESVYDLSVDGTETFLAGFGGLIVHNTYTAAKVIEAVQKPTLVMAHNKTLAAQLYQEFREFFPNNAVEYFVSYYDYFQPEAYLPRTDTYIEKDSSRNEEIDRLRHNATRALFERRDVVIVASVSAIYGLGAPVDYGATVINLKRGGRYRRDGILRHLVDLQYQRNDAALGRAKFRVRGDVLEVQPPHGEYVVRVDFFGDEVERIVEIDDLTGEVLAERTELNLYPATHYVTPREKLLVAMEKIESEMDERVRWLADQGRDLEAARLRQRTEFDLEMMREVGYCSGIENYSRHLAGREAGSRPWTLIDYFPTDFLLVVDESHITIPQVHGMYKNDRTRKEILVDFGFRLPSALDNRPLTFEEFEDHMSQVIYMSATPGPYETERAERVAEQFIRPTGVVDPTITVRPTTGQIDDLLAEIRATVERGERVLVTTLTKKMAEDLADYLAELGIKVQWLHSEVDTLERVEILRDLRLGVYDVLVGINLLREGLDLPEVTLVAILDADKEGFLRSGGSLIQVIGRAARNIGGRVLMYADRVTVSMKAAIDETDRRRARQIAYNTEHGIIPETIIKEIRDIHEGLRRVAEERTQLEVAGKEPEELAAMMGRLEAQMKEAARNLEFERAAALRDEILQLRRLREELAAAPGSIPADVYAAAADDGAAEGRRGSEASRVFSTATTPNVVAAGSRRRPPRRRRP
jgi:excinuclease ABC B subunit